MATGFYNQEVRTCSTISFPILVLLSLELFLSHHVQSYPVDLSSNSDSAETSEDSYWTYIILPLAFLISIVFFTFICAGGCCQVSKIHWFGRRRAVEVPMGFSNPVADAEMSMPISQIDVRALELDPIVFEPLPTLHDLTPVSSNQSRFHGDRCRDSFDPRTHLSPIVPFSSDDANVYAHDWFDEPHRNFPRGNIEYVKEVGKGWFGQVIEAEARDIVPFARKIRVLVKVLRDDATGVEQMRFLDESRWYRDSNHGSILKLLGHSIETIPFLLIMEHCPQGDLKSFLIANVTRAEMLNNDGAIVRMALDIAKGIEWMSSSDFIHADLATRNCQVGSEGRILIGDYGLATQAFRDDYYWSSNIAIPLRWTAPETLHCTINTIQTLKVTKLSNVWTFGVVLWEVCEFGKLPYFELSDDEVISRVIIDKNYTLGQPTMSCLAAKEQLYQVMQMCWNPIPEKRPTISSIVEELENIYKAIHTSSVISPGDEFDSKWEQLSRTPSSTDRDKGKKKNVSFLGFQEEGITDESQNLNDSIFGFPSDKGCISEESPQTDMSIPVSQSLTMESMSLCTNNDPDEEHWRTKIERGDISQKVREKSQSVQDLMVLTHFEGGELSDPESLVMISKSSSVFHQATMGLPSSSGFGDVQNGNSLSNGSNNGVSNSMRKSASETALSSICAFTSNSSQNPSGVGVPASHLGSSFPNPPSNPSTLSSYSSLNVNNVGFVKGDSATPENTDIKIKVTEATPIIEENGTQNGNHHHNSHTKSRNEKSNKNTPAISPKKLKIIFNSGGKTSQRHTSTPIRTPSPQVNFEGDVLEDSPSEVFYSLSPVKSNNFTWEISPITKQQNSTLEPNGFSSLVMGPSDDLGLKPYQKVTTELNESSVEFLEDTDAIDMSKSEEPLKVNFKLGSLENKVSNTKKVNVPEMSPLNHSFTKKAVPRKLFLSEESSPVVNDSNWTADNEKETLSSIPSISTSNPSHSFAAVDPYMTVSSGEMADNSASINPDNTSSRVNTYHSFNDQDLKCFKDDSSVIVSSCEDVDDFWEKQMQSFQEAAGNTRALFQLGLGQDGENDVIAKDKFVEDIEAAAEEFGSLVMTDLEEENFVKEVVRETREEVEVGRSIRSKIAFDQSAGVDEYPLEWEQQDSTIEDTEVTILEQSNGHLGMKVKSKESESDSSGSLHKNKSGKECEWEESEMEDDNDVDDICTDFVPSKWNQNLAPIKPAIKSPEQQPPTVHKSNLRKSVSFERKKPQLVYEYPPPPPASDSDDDDKVLLGTSLPLALSSSLDWELTQEELEESEINHEDWGEDDVITKAENPMDVYRISGFGDDQFHIRGSSEPFVFSPSTLGELRHTRDRLKLDLSKGEASILDEESKGAKLDSGVGSSTNVSPFNHCDNHT